MKLNLDKEGFLRDLSDWNPEVAEVLAKNEEITLSGSHWQIINLVRDYYQQYQISPVTRVLVKITREKLGEDKGNSIYLMKLFSGKPAKLVSKIAGLPKPANCD
jgi:tRNA 2-thiouridine synthesizing protein E